MVSHGLGHTGPPKRVGKTKHSHGKSETSSILMVFTKKGCRFLESSNSSSAVSLFLFSKR